jgi:perosamine synthetase
MSRPTAEQELLHLLRQVLGTPTNPVALHEPSLSARESALVEACLESTFVSSVGQYVGRFESLLADFTGARHAIAVVNGTAALQVGLTVMGIRPNDEVLVPALSFVATANAVVHAGATPHFVDSSPDTLGMDPAALASYLDTVAERTTEGVRNRTTGARIGAIVPMHTFGHPVDLAALLDIAGRLGLPVLEDAAESLGSTYQGRHTGRFGIAGTLSFNGNKVVTTGGGGAILTDDDGLAARARHLTTTAKRAHRWEYFHDEVAWNYRMPNLNAALGCAQMERLPAFLASKRQLAARYCRACEGLAALRFVQEPASSVSNYWLNTVCLTQPDITERDRALAGANDAGYQCRPAWTLLHRLPMFAACPRAPLPVAEALEASIINIPSSAALGA